MDVDAAVLARTSIRAFKPDPVSEAQVRAILDVARYAPSGGNVQPWKVIVVAGAEKEACSALAQRVLQENPRGEAADRPIYPEHLGEPYRSRRFKVGEDMYALLGIPREDKLARLMHLSRNFRFFDAPVGLFFVIDEGMGHGQWAHLGMFMQTIALVAQARGLSTCMQEAWAQVRVSLKAHFALAPEEMIYCGMALGYASDAPVNALRADRAPVDEFARFSGF
jgi:nitroreductase